MYKLKAVLAISLLISLLTGTIYFFSQGASLLPADEIESDHARVQDILLEKLSHAEDSLMQQANLLATDEKLVLELDSIRSTLLTTTPDELKATNNRWYKAVFDSLIDWKQKQTSAIKQHEATRSELMKLPEGSMTSQRPSSNWWKKSPDLLLAFAAVPMKDGVISSMLIAHGASSKQINALSGKRFNEGYPILTEVTHTQKAKFGHFIWDQKMYMAVVAPVQKNGNLIGLVVSGVELSSSMADSFMRALPAYIQLMFVYSSPKFGENAEKYTRQIYTTASDELRKAVETGNFHVMSNKTNHDEWYSFDKVPANLVYATSNKAENPIAFSRIRWTWNDKEETDLYVVSNLKDANKSHSKLQMQILLAGGIALLIGIILALVLVSMMQRHTHRIRKGIADAISSGEPIDGETMSLLTGENADDLAQYTIQQVNDDSEDAPEEWSNLMMDFDDDSNHKADAAITPEEEAKLKKAADIEEAKPLYEEYMALRKANNINTPMDFDCFLRRLQRNAAKIKATYKCDNVSFQVHVVDGNVVLKPKINKKKSA